MEPPGAFSVITFAIRLGDDINKLRNFLASITEAPKEIESIINELTFFTQLLSDIQDNEKNLGPHPAIKQALERCEAPLQDLQQIADSLVPGFAASSALKRKWTAITAIRAKDNIAKFKETLRAAKIDLLLARTLSSDRSHQQYYQSYQESLVPVIRGIAELHEKLSCHLATSNGHSHAERSLGAEVLTDFRESLSSWPVEQFRATLEADLSKKSQRTVTMVTDQAGEGDKLLSTTVQERHADCAALFQRYRNRVAVSQSSITKSLLLGTVQYKSTSYAIRSTPPTSPDNDANASEEQLEVAMSFSFVPSWLMAKLLTNRVIELSTRGWQAGIRSFNVCTPVSNFRTAC